MAFLTSECKELIDEIEVLCIIVKAREIECRIKQADSICKSQCESCTFDRKTFGQMQCEECKRWYHDCFINSGLCKGKTDYLNVVWICICGYSNYSCSIIDNFGIFSDDGYYDSLIDECIIDQDEYTAQSGQQRTPGTCLKEMSGGGSRKSKKPHKKGKSYMTKLKGSTFFGDKRRKNVEKNAENDQCSSINKDSEIGVSGGQ